MRRTGCGAGRASHVPACQPGPFAQLVADRLTGTAEVADDLAGLEILGAATVGGEELKRQVGRPSLAGPDRRVSRNLQPKVHADVDDHPDRAQVLRVKVAEARAWHGQVTE